MNEIENVLITGDSMNIALWEQAFDGQQDKQKIGEIFQLKDGGHTLSCIQCLQEFQYFSEFSLHIEEHFLNGDILRLNQIKIEEEQSTVTENDTNVDTEECDSKFQLGTNDAQSDNNVGEFENDEDDDGDNQFDDTTFYGTDDENTPSQKALFQMIIDGRMKETEYRKENDKLQCMVCSSQIKKWYHFRQHCRNHLIPVNQAFCPLCSKSFLNVAYVRKHIYRFHRLKYTVAQVSEAQKEFGVSLSSKQRSQDNGGTPKLEQDLAESCNFDVNDKESKPRQVHSEAVHEDKQEQLEAGKHYRKVNKMYQCLTCNRSIKRFSDFQEHHQIHAGIKDVICPICFRKYLTISYVRKHIRGCHDQKYSNTEIKQAQKELHKMASTVSLEEKPRIQKILPKAKSLSKPFRCIFCTNRFAKPRYVQKHMIIMHGKRIKLAEIETKQQVTDTNDNSERKNEAPAPVSIELKMNEKDDDTKPTMYECFHCHRQMKQWKSLAAHIRLHSGIKFACPQCDRSFTAKNYVRDHLVFKHGILRNEIGKDMISTTTIAVRPRKITGYECFLCKNRFQLEKKLTKHMLTHTMAPLLCTICGTVYRSRDTLRHHMELHNADPNKPHKCNDCEKIFPTRRYMLNHRRTVHRTEKEEKRKKGLTVKCNECEKMFLNQHNLNQHMKVHFKDPSELVCKVCGWKFNERGNLIQHMRTHSNNKTNCTVCHKVLSIRYLQEHMKIHRGIKDFQCSTCGSQFVTQERLRKHMIRHVGELKYKCEKCPKAYARSDKLLYHLRQTHPELLTLTCGTCNKGFLSIRALKKHENEHYKEEKGIGFTLENDENVKNELADDP